MCLLGCLLASLEQQQIAEHLSIGMLIASLEQQQISRTCVYWDAYC